MMANYTPLPPQPSVVSQKSNSHKKGLFQGRLNRLNYLIGSTIISSVFFGYVWITANIVPLPTAGLPDAILRTTTILLFVFYGLSFGIRRVQDWGWSGWGFFLILIPGFNIVFLFLLLLKKGYPAENKYGGPDIEVNFKHIFLGS